MQTNNTSHINTPVVGMNTDLALLNSTAKSYTYALNASVSDFTGEEFLLNNTHSNVLKANFPEGFIVIGKKAIYEQNRVIYMLVNPTTKESEIGEILSTSFEDITDSEFDCINGDCTESYNKEETPLELKTQTSFSTYNPIINSDCLNFNIDNPILIEYRLTECGLNIYFTDNLNQRRYMYFEYTPSNNLKLKQEFYKITGYDPLNCNLPIYSSELDCNKILYNPQFVKPCIDFIDLTNIGSLKAGVYQFMISYADAAGNTLTNYFPASNTIPVFTKPITTVTNYDTDKAIVIDINNIDNQTFLYYNLVVAETIDNFTEFKFIGTFPTNFLTKERYTYTGNDQTLKKLTALDILFKRPYYDTAKSVTKANNYLFFSNLKEYKQLNLQRAANRVKLYWQTIALPEAVYSNPRNSFKYRTYQRDEVYALGIIFEGFDGWETPAFHIPNNDASYYQNTYGINVYDIITSYDALDDTSCADQDINKRYQVYNTAQVIPGLSEYKFTENCDNPNNWETGDFAYSESTEKYPNDPIVWGELCGQPIRHHRMPDSCVTHIHDSKCGSKHFSDNNIVYPLGIKVDHTSVINALTYCVQNGIITEEDKQKIKGYRIVRGNRSGNKSIVAKGLLYDMWSYTKDSVTYSYPNYPYNDLNQDFFISNSKTTYEQDKVTTALLPNTKAPIPSVFIPTSRWTFHSPDTHFVNPSLGNVLKLETVEYGESEGYFDLCDEQAKYKRLSFFSRLIAFGMGIAAALSATEEKECVTYTIKSDYKTKVNKYEVDSSGKTPVGIVTGALALGTGNIQTTVQDKSWSGKAKVPDITSTQDNSVCLPQVTFDKKDGTKVTGDTNKIMTAASDAVKACKDLNNENVVEQYTRTTCTGTPHQLLSTGTENGPMAALNNVLKVLLGGISGPQLVQQVLLGMKEMQIVLDLITSLVPEKNYAIQYNSVGRYNNYTCVPNNLGIKQRSILKGAYLEPTNQLVSANATVTTFPSTNINNWNRESSVYIQADALGAKGLLQPHQVNSGCVFPDNSRVTMGKDGMDFKYNDLNKKFTRNIASYYSSIKNYVPDQYGKVHTIEYLETTSCTINLDSQSTPSIFGGDTFINRFALKRKMPFFKQTRFKQLNGSDVQYSDLGNVGYPNYYFDSQKALFDRLEDNSILGAVLNPLGLLSDVVGLEDSRLDVKVTNVFYQKGYIHLYNYGIPYFLVESDINVDYRYGQNNKEKDFYPHNSNLDEWLQEKNVPITEDNYYFYNKTYSKQNKESFIQSTQVNFKPNEECRIKHPNRIIYSDSQDLSTLDFDNWRVFKANSYYDFPLSDGTLISADGIESDKVLVRSENMSRIFGAYNLIPTDTQNIQVETGGIFKSRPQEFVVADLGYAGTQHNALINTEFGHIWVDAKRGNIFNLGTGGSGLDELSKNGMKNWFKENLPFQLLKDFPQIDVDNNFKGIGLSLCYDRRFHRFFITKLDYRVLSKEVKFEPLTKTFYVLNGQTRIEVSLDDTKYFCNKSWTLSYNFYTKTWVSFHSFKPLFYNYFIDTFESGIKGSLWSHNETNKSYQVYYGQLHPFIIEYPTQVSASNNDINSIEYSLDVIRFHNSYDFFYNRTKTFNKAIIFNDRQCTGLLELVVKDENNLSQIIDYPKYTQTSTQILTTNSENIWRFNNFYNLVSSELSNQPLFLNTCSNDYKYINPKTINYFKRDIDRSRIKSKQSRIRLINDKYSNYLFSFNFSQTNQNKSYR